MILVAGEHATQSQNATSAARRDARTWRTGRGSSFHFLDINHPPQPIIQKRTSAAASDSDHVITSRQVADADGIPSTDVVLEQDAMMTGMISLFAHKLQWPRCRDRSRITGRSRECSWTTVSYFSLSQRRTGDMFAGRYSVSCAGTTTRCSGISHSVTGNESSFQIPCSPLIASRLCRLTSPDTTGPQPAQEPIGRFPFSFLGSSAFPLIADKQNLLSPIEYRCPRCPQGGCSPLVVVGVEHRS